MSIIITEDTSIQVKPNDLGGAELALASGQNLMFTQMSYDKLRQLVGVCNRILDQIKPFSHGYCAICYHPFENGLCPHCEADLADLPLGGDLCS